MEPTTHLRSSVQISLCWYSVLRTLHAPVSPKSLLCLLNLGRLAGFVWVPPDAAVAWKLSRQQPTNKAQHICFPSLGGQCLMLPMVQGLTTISHFLFVLLLLKWENKSRSYYTIKLYFKDNLENVRHRTSLVVQWLKLSSQCRGLRINPWSGN